MAEIPPYTIIVLDANDDPVIDAVVTVDGVSYAVEAEGRLRFNVDNTPTHSLTVVATGFVPESVSFLGDIKTADWSNALLRRDTDPLGTTFTIRLGRLEVAPVVTMTDADVEALGKLNGDAQGVLLDLLDDATPVYRDQTLTPNAVWLTGTSILPPAPTPGATGWARFTGAPVDPPAEPRNSGRFFWLTQLAAPKSSAKGAKNGPFAVAVWSPNIDVAAVPDKLDMVVFFSPTNDFYKARYPWGVIPSRLQQYANQGARYLLEQHWFVYFLVARQRRAVFVMPIYRRGDYGPYASGEGIFRLCREVMVFLHRECRTSNLALTSTVGVPSEKLCSGGSLRQASSPIFSSDFGLIPRPGQVAVGGFSQGILHAKELMQPWGWGLTKGYTQRYWGCPNVRADGQDPLTDPRQQWAAAWREIWDLDGYHAETGGWPNYLNLIKAWMFDGDPAKTRAIRMCHTLEQPDPKVDSHATWKALKSEGGVTENYNNPGAREMQGPRWSVVHLNGSVVDIGENGHQAAPKIGFSYFTASSPIGVPTGPSP